MVSLGVVGTYCLSTYLMFVPVPRSQNLWLIFNPGQDSCSFRCILALAFCVGFNFVCRWIGTQSGRQASSVSECESVTNLSWSAIQDAFVYVWISVQRLSSSRLRLFIVVVRAMQDQTILRKVSLPCRCSRFWSWRRGCHMHPAFAVVVSIVVSLQWNGGF